MTSPTSSPQAAAPQTRRPLEVRLRDRSLSEDLARLRTQLGRGLLDSCGLVVDVSGVERLSSPSVAAILWARRSCAARNVPFQVTGHRGRNQRILRSCGLVDGGGSRRW